MIEITEPMPLPLGQRRLLKATKLFMSIVGCCIGFEFVSTGISVLSGGPLDAWEEKFLHGGTLTLCLLTLIAWKTREVNGITRALALFALASLTLFALTQYEWRWFAYASIAIIGIYVLVVSLGAMISIWEKRA